MNGFGVGSVVGLGTLIGLGLVSPGAPLAEYISTFVFYGFCAGVLAEVVRFALTFRR